VGHRVGGTVQQTGGAEELTNSRIKIQMQIIA
jgi:hypothetical protein